MQLDDKLVLRLRRPMNITWQQIAPDLYECCPNLDNEEAIEMCIDANRLAFNGEDEEADILVRELCKEHGYHTVLKFLSSKFNFA